MSEKKRNRIFWITQISFSLIFLTIVYITIYRPFQHMKESLRFSDKRIESSQNKNESKSVVPVLNPPAPDLDTEIQRNVPLQEVHPPERKNDVNEDPPGDPPVAKEQDLPEESVSPVEQPSEKNRFSAEEHKAFMEEAEAFSEEAKAAEAEMWKVFEPLLPQLVAQLNELSGDEQLAVIKQMRANLRDSFSAGGTVTESTLDEMTALFLSKMEAEGFIRRF
ncbi:hypothetical protein J5I95_22815 [Candidatus Poribacteria bacterium]|nr:hypothetical protein [Candidatus Poribacteria bacterium]